MRRLFVLSIASVVALGWTSAAPARQDSAADDSVEVFGFGHVHEHTEGWFFPGTVPCEDFNCTSVPLTITRGTDIKFTGMDEEAHQMTSFDKKGRGKKKRPVFKSALVAQGQSDIIETSKLKPGTYRFHCNVHPAMLGVLEITSD